jgi:MATE family multidrug resistance protein
MAFAAVSASAMVLWPMAMLGIYIDPYAPANAALVGFALQFLIVAAAFQFVDGLQAVAAGALRGVQDTRIPMLFAVFSYWVPGMGVSVLLGFYTPLAGVGVWLGLAAGLIVASILLLGRWMRRDRLNLDRHR